MVHIVGHRPSVRDVLLVPLSEPVDQEEIGLHPPIVERVDVGRGVYVAQLDSGECQAIAGWDPDQVLATVHQLSRLVIDHAHGLEWAARVEYASGEMRAVRPQEFGSGRWAYRFNPDTRHWLDRHDAKQLLDLMANFWAAEPALSPRLRRALWMCEYMTHVRWLEYAIALMVTALESLLSTSRHHVTHQFQNRVVALAAEVGCPVSEGLARRAYALRSSAWHGEPVPLDQPPPEHARAAEEAAILQRVLRAALRRAIDDPGFRGHFDDDAAVDARWPI